MKQLTLGFSPCPNDTFIFDAMIHGKIETEGLQFEVSLEDVETLNRKEKLHIRAKIINMLVVESLKFSTTGGKI